MLSASPREILLVVTFVPAWLMLVQPIPRQIVLYQAMSVMLALAETMELAATGRGTLLPLIVTTLGLALLARPLLSIASGDVAFISGQKTFKLGGANARSQLAILATGGASAVVAYGFTSTLLAGLDTNDTVSVAASLTYVVLGLMCWLLRTDLLSHALALLVMDHAVLLAARFISGGSPVLLGGFVLLHLVVPILFLTLLMPALRQRPGGLKSSDLHAELRG